MNIWEQTLARIETKVNRHSFYTWFKPTTCILDGGDHLTIRVPNGLFRDWLLKHYGGIMADALAEIGRPGTLLTFVTEEPSAPFQESVSAPLPSIAPSVPDRRQRKSLSGANSRRSHFRSASGTVSAPPSAPPSRRRQHSASSGNGRSPDRADRDDVAVSDEDGI